MSLFNVREWSNFRRSSVRRPWYWPVYAIQLAALVYRRFSNSRSLRRQSQPHLGLKQRPEWLKPFDLRAGRSEGAPSFPDYAAMQCFAASALPESPFLPDSTDPEAQLAKHRWGNCLLATLVEGELAKESLSYVRAWLAQPPEKHDAAWETYSCCERVANLAVLIATRPTCRALMSDETLSAFFQSSAEWIDSRLEYYGLERTNNHLLNNARALVIAGRVLSNPEMVAEGLQIFARMSRELFGESGFLRERSSHYQFVVANWLFDVLHFARGTDASCGAGAEAFGELEILGQRVASATAKLIALLGDQPTHVGDISPDAHPRWTVARLRLLYPERLLLNESDFVEHDRWPMLKQGDCGLVGSPLPDVFPFDYASHGHQDLASFIWIHRGYLLLVDAGRSSYAKTDDAKFQCSPAAHNTLTINALAPLSESLLDAGLWLPATYAAAVIKAHVDIDGFAIDHAGFSRIPGVEAHQRDVRMLADGLTVRDAIAGSAAVDVEIYWHFPPGFVPQGEGAVQGDGLSLEVLSDIKEATLSWQEYPFSKGYGELLPAPMLTMKGRIDLPCTISTHFKVIPCAV